MQTPAEVVLRLLLLKHIRNWSYDVLEREVRANLVYRAFTRIGDEKVPDAKTLARLGQLIEPRVVEQLHQRVVELAQERGVTQSVGLSQLRKQKLEAAGSSGAVQALRMENDAPVVGRDAPTADSKMVKQDIATAGSLPRWCVSQDQ